MEPNTLARLKRVAGKQTMTLTHYGRKTWKPHEVTIWFVLDDDKLYIGTANVVGGERFEGEAHFLAERAEHERAMAAIRRKYWIYRPLIALGQILTAIGVMRDKTGAFEVVLAR